MMGAHQDTNCPAPSSHLFTLRLWPENVGEGQSEWRGKVQHVSSGEVRFFRDWPTLEAFVEELLSTGNVVKPDDGAETGRQPWAV